MPKINQLKRLAWVFRQPGGLRGLLSWKPFSLTAFRMLRLLKDQHLDFQTIIDGGANIGQFARAATEFFPDARIVSIEALPEVATRLRENLADRPQVRVLTSALGSHSGMLTFYKNDYSPASSALPQSARQEEAFPETRRAETTEVPVERLDVLLEGEALRPPVLLKLDLQGYELEALRGAPETLRQSQHVLLEVSFIQLYEDEPLFDDVHAFMREAGFRFVRPLDVLRDAGGEIVQMDAFYTRDAPA